VTLRAAAVVPWLFLAAGSAAAESGLPAYSRVLDGVPVFDGMGPVERPWLGGWETPRPQLLDADGDGDADLFVFESIGRLRFYRNDGTPSAPDFVFVTDDWGGVHDAYFGRVVDVDGDGALDLLTQAPEFETEIGGQTVFRTGAYLYMNQGTSTEPVLVNQSTHPQGYLVDTSGDPIPCVTTAPDLVDLEGDGDKDLIMGDPSGSFILYRNVGTPGAPAFVFETDHYQDLLIVFGSCTGEAAEPRTLGAMLEADAGLRHGYMLFTFHDVDGDGLMDLFLGDQFNSNVYFLENLGGTPNPEFACRTQDYFPPQPDFAQMLVTAMADLDADGDPDAILGSGVSFTTGLFLFRNDGTPTAPLFRILDPDYLAELDFGGNATVTFADLGGSGVPDLFFGTGSDQRVARFGNYGAPGAPSFGLDEPVWLPLPNAAWAAVEFADLDGDGDLDRFVGMTSGAVRWWRNTGTPTAPAFTEVTNDAAFGDVVGRTIRTVVNAQAVPRFLDDDGDGDLDLIVGGWSFSGEARLILFRNDGSRQVPNLVLASTDWRGFGVLGQQLAPVFGDQDGDGDLDLLVGRLDGTFVRAENLGTPAVPVFGPMEVVPGLDVGQGAVPAFLDIDGDGDADLVVAESAGGLNLFRADPTGPAPPAFALEAPAAGAAVNGRRPVRFEWPAVTDPATGSECTYELRIAGLPEAPPHEWLILAGLTASEADVTLHVGDFRFREHFVWTVVAHGVRPAPVPAWRPAVHATYDGVHGDPIPPEEVDPTPRTPPSLALRASPVPARGSVRLDVAWPADAPGRVEIFDLAGRRVITLHDGMAVAGEAALAWDVRDASGRPVAAGVYLVRVRQGAEAVTERVVVLR
jgi:hypothetical protein